MPIRASFKLVSKKNFRLRHEALQGQVSNIPSTGINATIIKKNQKIEVDLSQIECYNRYKKNHCVTKYPYKEPKNLCQSCQSLSR